MKRKMVLAVLCVLLAIGIGFVLLPAYNNQQYKKVTAVIAAQDIPAGTVITDKMLTQAEVFSQAIPADTLGAPDKAVGKYASRYISKSDYVTKEKIVDTKPGEEQMTVSANKMIVSVTIPSAAAGVSGILKPGDLVSVYAVPAKSSGGGSTIVNAAAQATLPAAQSAQPVEASAQPTPLATVSTAPELPDDAVLPDELKYVEVAGVYSGSAKTDDKANTTAIPTTVSFYVNSEQAKKLVDIEDGAALHLVFVARGDARLRYLGKEELQVWS